MKGYNKLSQNNNVVKQILKSIAMMGSSSILNILLGIIRTKFSAVILGPTGVGVVGLLGAIMNTASTIGGMGLSTSGIQQISLIRSTNLQSEMNCSKKALWYLTIFSALTTLTVVITLKSYIVDLTELDSAYSEYITWLGFGAFFTIITGYFTSIINAYHEITYLAKGNMLVSVVTTLLSVLLIWKIGLTGIVVALAFGSVVGMAIFGYYYYQICRDDLDTIEVPFSNLLGSMKRLLTLGISLMLCNVVSILTQLMIRIYLVKKFDVDFVGHFQAAWNISMLYMGVILSSMSADYFPRLVSISNNKIETSKLINQQMYITLLLALPLIGIMVVYAPLIISILYTVEFVKSVEILEWQLLGDVFKAMVFVFGWVFAAQERKKTAFFLELMWNLLYVILVIFGCDIWGSNFVGQAFLIAYSISFIVNYSILKKLGQFSWDERYLKIIIAMIGCLVLIANLALVSQVTRIIAGTIIVILMGMFSFIKIRMLLKERQSYEK